MPGARTEGQSTRFATERQVPIGYKGHRVRGELKIDLLVENCVVVELRSVERLHPLHAAQVITYLKLTGCPAALLLNFNATTLRAGLKRLDHPDRYLKTSPGGVLGPAKRAKAPPDLLIS